MPCVKPPFSGLVPRIRRKELRTMKNKNRRISFGVPLALAGVILLSGSSLRADDQNGKDSSQCKGLPSYADLQAQLKLAQAQSNGGFCVNIWATGVKRGRVGFA